MEIRSWYKYWHYFQFEPLPHLFVCIINKYDVFEIYLTSWDLIKMKIFNIEVGGRLGFLSDGLTIEKICEQQDIRRLCIEGICYTRNWICTWAWSERITNWDEMFTVQCARWSWRSWWKRTPTSSLMLSGDKDEREQLGSSWSYHPDSRSSGGRFPLEITVKEERKSLKSQKISVTLTNFSKTDRKLQNELLTKKRIPEISVWSWNSRTDSWK